MRTIIPVAAAALLAAHNIAAQACAEGSAKEIKGNWYCSSVKGITYTNFPGTGSYNKITYMDAASGQCRSERYQYSGSLAPLNEEVSFPFLRVPAWKNIKLTAKIHEAVPACARPNLAETSRGLFPQRSCGEAR